MKNGKRKDGNINNSLPEEKKQMLPPPKKKN
jgi:hypothetical protein